MFAQGTKRLTGSRWLFRLVGGRLELAQLGIERLEIDDIAGESVTVAFVATWATALPRRISAMAIGNWLP